MSSLVSSIGHLAAGRLRPARLAVLLGLLALGFHALLPLTQIAIQRVQAANGIEQTMLCSALGFRVLALKDGQPVDADPGKPQKAAQNCPLCLGSGGPGPAILPSAIALLLPTLALTMPFGATADSTLAQSGHHPAQARAPPVFRS